jgi:hypothetical protein
MTLHGTIQNGMVVFDPRPDLPNGTPVTVVVEATPTTPRQELQLSDEEHRQITEVMDRIAGLPIEGTGEPFSGRDHDRVLYGRP